MFRVSRKLTFHCYNYSTVWAKGRRRGEIMTERERERERETKWKLATISRPIESHRIWNSHRNSHTLPTNAIPPSFLPDTPPPFSTTPLVFFCVHASSIVSFHIFFLYIQIPAGCWNQQPYRKKTKKKTPHWLHWRNKIVKLKDVSRWG